MVVEISGWWWTLWSWLTSDTADDMADFNEDGGKCGKNDYSVGDGVDFHSISGDSSGVVLVGMMVLTSVTVIVAVTMLLVFGVVAAVLVVAVMHLLLLWVHVIVS